MKRLGEEIIINNRLYIIVGIYNDGNLSYGLLDAHAFTIGFSDENIEVVINSYQVQ